ncbi:MAG: hypothetical protein KA764_22535 [Anaerolineales bacterium]|nr:hypothetical protein [Anaerolineales bacterium]
MSKRPLSASELAEARLVFADGLDYTRVRVAEASPFPNFIADIGAFFQGKKRTWDNAVTLGDTSYFPRQLRTSPADLAAGLTDMAWLIHELTHQWQFQTAGWRYLSEALHVQLTLGPAGYDYAGKAGSPREALRAASQVQRRFLDFNREQQGDIARDYYVARKRGEDVAAWQPFVDDLRKLGRPSTAGRA